MKRGMAFGIAVALTFAAPATVRAQQGHGSSNTPAATHGSASAHGGGQTHGSSTHGSSATHQSHGGGTQATKPSHGSSTHKSSTTTKTTKTTRGTKATKTETSKKSATTTTSTDGSKTTLTPVQQKLQKNTKLASKLQSRLPEGTDLMKAAAGFRNLGQFVAAVNVSHNLDIPFMDLKKKMVTDGLSLGQAIQSLRPAANATTEVEHAEHEADEMIQQTTTSTAQPKPAKRHHS